MATLPHQVRRSSALFLHAYAHGLRATSKRQCVPVAPSALCVKGTTMRFVLCLISLASLIATGAHAQAPATPTQARLGRTAVATNAITDPFRSAEAIGRWMNAYRVNPEPHKLPHAFRAMAELGVLADQDASGLYVGFVAGVLGANPGKARELIDLMFPLAPEHHASLIKAIAYSGLPGWQPLLRGLAERMPSRVVLIDRLVTGRMPALDGLQLDAGPVPLDVMWGFYFGSGATEPLLRIVSVLKWARDADDVERLTVGSMVKWTLATNASRDVTLLRFLKSAMSFETKDVRAQLSDVILAAETGEIQKIRKEALTAIEQLKAKGPAHARNAQWWGQAGQMALSLGCVAASALGAGAAIGIPCVIGGAASTAALKMTAPQ